MAGEISRKTSVRRITAPDDDSVYVDLKIIDQIRFVDPQDKYQEWELSYENNLNAGRQVRVVEVGDENLQVERIDFLRKVIAGYRFQEWENEYNNGDDPPVHYETHKRKIYALEADGVTKNEDIWIEVQRIDKILFKDPKDHYQEKIWELKWPDLENEEWDYQDLTDPVTDWDGTSINPPWRLDPYQTIVDCSFASPCLLILHGGNSIKAIRMKDVYAGSLDTAVYSATLTGSAWDYGGIGDIVQEQLSENMSAISTTLTIGSSNIIISTGMVYDNGLKFGIESESGILTGGKIGDYVYGYGMVDNMRYSNSTGFVRLGDAPETLAEAGGGYLSPTGAMDPNRTDYSYSGFDYQGPVTTNFMNTEIGGGEREYSPPDKFTLVGYLTHFGYSQKYTYLASTIDTGIVEQVWSIYGYTYSTFTQSYVINYPVFPIYHNVGDDAHFIEFPYPVGQKPYYTLGHMDQHGGNGAPNSDNSTYEFVTPHERLDTTANTIITGKWNLHNGGVLIQCVDVERIDIPESGVERVIYVNGVRANSIAGIAANEIEAAFIDIPLSKIRAFT